MKILIASHSLDIGGAERSLVGLLNAIAKTDNDVSLFLNRHRGEFMNMIPPKIKLLPEEKKYTALARPMKRILTEGMFGMAVRRVYAKLRAQRFNKKHDFLGQSYVEVDYSNKYCVKGLPKITPEITYDLALSFLAPHYFVSHNVNARKKAAWIHFDYTKANIDVDSEVKIWGTYDYIVAISEGVKASFIKVFPSLSDKIVLVENILSSDFTRRQAEAFTVESEMPSENGVIKMLSIGRYCYAKNFDNLPFICRNILDMGIPVKWYIIGIGDDSYIKKAIAESHTENNVFILGKKVNPYPYIAACDIYVQPSRFEGKSVTVKEAQILCKPTVITDFNTAHSHLEEGVDGIIVPLENKACAEGIAALIKDETLRNRLVDNCRSRDYGNEEEMYKIIKWGGENA